MLPEWIEQNFCISSIEDKTLRIDSRGLQFRLDMQRMLESFHQLMQIIRQSNYAFSCRRVRNPFSNRKL
jgi:hypothetical protein